MTGYQSFAAGRARSITGLSTPDPTTLVVQLDQPFADLPALVASLPLSPLPTATARPDPAAYLASPMGNGPFRLAAPPPRPLPDPGPQPRLRGLPALLDKVSVRVVPDEQTAWLELQNGQVSFAPVPSDQLAAARTVHGLSADGRTAPGLLQGPTLTTWNLTFNLKSKLGGDRRWRQAVSSPPTASAWLPPWPAPRRQRWSHRPRPTATGPAGEQRLPARPAPTTPPGPALLARTRSAGTPVTLAIPPGAEARALAAALTKDLATAGIELTPDPTPAGETPVTLVRGFAPYPRPDPFLAAPAAASPRRSASSTRPAPPPTTHPARPATSRPRPAS